MKLECGEQLLACCELAATAFWVSCVLFLLVCSFWGEVQDFVCLTSLVMLEVEG